MAQTTFANGRGIAHKGSGGISIAFPDVCKVPAPPAPFVPAPFPNVAQTAIKKRASKSKTKTTAATTRNSQIGTSQGDEPGTVKGIVSSRNMDKAVHTSMAGSVRVQGKKVVIGGSPGLMSGATPQVMAECQQIRVVLNALNAKLQNMTTSDPAAWEQVLLEYASAAAALYVTLYDDE